MATVVQRAARGGTGGVVGRHHEAVDVSQVRGRAGDTHEGLARDAAVVERVELVFPLAGAVLADFGHRHTVVVDFLEHFQLRPHTQVPAVELAELLARHATGGLAVGVEEVRVGRTFMVHHEHRAARLGGRVAAAGIDVEQVHAVVVVAHAHGPFVGFGADVAVSRDAGDQAIAGGVHHPVGVAGGQDHVVQQALVNG